MCLFSRTQHGGGILGGLPESSLGANNIIIVMFVKLQRKHIYAGTLAHAVRKYIRICLCKCYSSSAFDQIIFL